MSLDYSGFFIIQILIHLYLKPDLLNVSNSKRILTNVFLLQSLTVIPISRPKYESEISQTQLFGYSSLSRRIKTNPDHSRQTKTDGINLMPLSRICVKCTGRSDRNSRETKVDVYQNRVLEYGSQAVQSLNFKPWLKISI